MNDTDIEHDEIVPADVAPSTGLERRRFDAPLRLEEIAMLKADEGVAIIKAQETILTTLRASAIRMTSPEDWVLNKTPDEQGGQITAYLENCGGQRLRKHFRIEIFNVGDPPGSGNPTRIPTADPKVFYYVIRGDGRCNLTGEVIEGVEGARGSTGPWAANFTGEELEINMRRAARTNLDGRITRDLAGLNSVPAAELEAAWAGTTKKLAQCRRGKGFGTRDARMGGDVARDAGIDPPVCRLCNSKMVLRKGQRGDFYSCPKYRDHGKDAYTVDADKWIKEHPPTLTPSQAAGFTGAPTTPPPSRVTHELREDEVFGGRRERQPGEDDE